MKRIVRIITGIAVLASSAVGQAAPEGSDGESVISEQRPRVGPSEAKPSVPVVVRGWEVQSALAVRSATVTRSLPDYRQRKLAGSIKVDVPPEKGEYLVLLVQSRWATRQAPNETLWASKPAVTLVDDQGSEYALKDVLSWKSGEYRTRGMSNSSRRQNPAFQSVPRTSRALIYFDVPSASGRTYGLRFSATGPILPVTRVVDLPQLDLSRLD